MRALSVALVLAALLFGSAVARDARSPCKLATKAEVRAILRATPVPVVPGEVGEETAPYCLWTTGVDGARVKLEIWSPDELAVLGFPAAKPYFLKRQRDALANGGIRLRALGDAAFGTWSHGRGRSIGASEIGALKRGRVLIFTFDRVSPARAETFARAVARRL